MVMSGVNNNKQTVNSLKTTEVKNDLYSILQACANHSNNSTAQKDIKIANPAFPNIPLGGGTVV